MNLTLSIIGLSVVLQFLSALLAIRLILRTGNRLAGMLIFATTAMMAFRRCVSLYRFAAGGYAQTDLFAETIALVVSLLLVVGIIYVGRLLQSEKVARESLSRSERRSRILAEASFEGVAISEEGRLVDVSPQLLQLLGYDSSEMIGRPVEEFVVPGDKELVRRNIGIGYEMPYENSLLRKDGTVVNVETRARYLERGDRKIRVTVIRDITERKKAEEELRQYRDHLEELVGRRTSELEVLNDQLRQAQKLEAVGILAGGIAHEFKNILATMKGSLYLMQKKMQGENATMKYVEQLIASINKANNLSQGLLAFSRKQTISPRPVFVNEIVHGVAKLLGQFMGEQIELKVMLTDRNPKVMADINQTEQVLLNLVTNARDAMPRGGTLTIRTDVVEMDGEFRKKYGYGVAGEYALVTVSDTGEGMEETVKEKIFEPFFTTKEVGKGSGLGLAVTYGIVKQHNGFIDVESVPGEGTTFRIYIPTVHEEVMHLKD